jgi:hypothetical protein
VVLENKTRFRLRCDGRAKSLTGQQRSLMPGVAIRAVEGFGPIDESPSQGINYELVEFYVDARLRRQRFGDQAARALFNSQIGTWSVSVRRDNVVGQKFWASLLGHLASVTLHERQAPDGVIYKFTSPIGEV